MKEKIYTIIINEAFEKPDDCPLCSLFNKLEDSELDIILGGAMMEPDVRDKTNKQGFCNEHFEKLQVQGKKLPLALILQSHLKEMKRITENKKSKDKAESLKKIYNDCYICNRISDYMSDIYGNIFYLYTKDVNFSGKLIDTDYICLHHSSEIMEYALKHLSKKEIEPFYNIIENKLNKNIDCLLEDVTHFCDLHDYRFKDEPLGKSKDSIKRTIKFLD